MTPCARPFIVTPARTGPSRHLGTAPRPLGLTLVELMVALALGLVIVTGMLYFFSGNQQNHRQQEALSRVQEAGRFALDLMGRDLRMAGYAGCGNLANLQVRPAAAGLDLGSAVTGQQGATVVPGLPPADTLLMRQATTGAQAFLGRLQGMSSDQTQLLLADLFALGEAEPASLVGQQLLVTDCAFADVLTVAAVDLPSNQIVATAPLSRGYPANAQVLRFEEVLYSIGVDADGRSSLLRNGLPVAEGIANLQLRFGVNTTADRSADTYLPAGAVTDWASVVAVEVTLLAASPENNVSPQTQTLQVGELGAVTPADRRLYQVFETTVALRNKLP